MKSGAHAIVASLPPLLLQKAAINTIYIMSTLGGSGLPSWQGRLARALPQKPVCFTYACAELRFIRSVYARLGIHIVTATPPLPGGYTLLNVDGDKILLIPTWPNMDVNLGLTPAQWKLVSESYPSVEPARSVLRVFFVGRLSDNSCGPGANPNGCYSPTVGTDAVWVADRWRATGTTSAAHEMGHALGLPHVVKNPQVTPPINENPVPGSRFAPLNNLMADPPSQSQFFFGTACFPGRLWDVEFASGSRRYNQYQTVRSSGYIRPWPTSAAQPANLFPAVVP